MSEVLSAEEVTAIRERAEEAIGPREAPYRLVTEVWFQQRELCDTVEALRALLAEKTNELAVAYGSGRTEPEQEWFSALDRAKAEAASMRALATELAGVLLDYRNIQRDLSPSMSRYRADVLAKARDAGLLP